MILSLQGCMAVGKTTVARYLEQHCQQVQVCFEDNAAVLAEIKRCGLNKNCYADYLEIQRLFLRNELRRGQKAKKYPHAVMDFGAEEIEFYTLNYPKSRGLEWKIEAIRQALAPELAVTLATSASTMGSPCGVVFTTARPISSVSVVVSTPRTMYSLPLS